MITQHNVWNAIDDLAARYKTSPSRMAINSGLDATIFNKSKRTDEFGKPRYPSFRTVIKVLNALNMSMAEFGAICDKHNKESSERKN